MPSAPYPPNESARLDALMRAAILDSGVEEFFEDAVDSLQRIVDAPIVFISLIDEWRQWMKAKRGLNLTETPRQHAFCAYTILNDRTLVIKDARLDARFADNPLVSGENAIVAYAGAPIVLPCGARLGAVCAVDHQPRDWNADEVAQLQRSARMVARHLDVRRGHLEKDRSRFLEVALARAEERYDSVLQSMSEGMVVHGPSGAIIDSNPAAWEILGLSQDELFGRASKDPRWRAIRADGSPFPGEEHPSMLTLGTGQPQHGVLMGVETPSGERRWLSVNSYPIRRPGDGRIDQVVAVFRLTDPPRALKRAG